jgi:alcohol dehydrogenase
MVDSEPRKDLWEKLATDWKSPLLEEGIKELTLEELPEAMDKMLKGQHLGRVLVKLRD